MKTHFDPSNKRCRHLTFLAALVALVAGGGMSPAFAQQQVGPDPAIATISHGSADVDYGSYTPEFLPVNVENGNGGTWDEDAEAEMLARVWYPADLKPGPSGKFPLLVFMHGRHPTCFDAATAPSDPTAGQAFMEWPCVDGQQPTPIPSDQGYDYLAQGLANEGFVVVSISANGINANDTSAAGSDDDGMTARAQLIQEHLYLLCQFNGNSPCGNPPEQNITVSPSLSAQLPAGLKGLIDFTHIGLMGHSRGGEAVVTFFNQNTNPSNFVVHGVVSLAGTRFNSTLVAKNVPFMGVLPYCDGDLDSLPTIGYFDQDRYPSTPDNTPKYFALVMGGDHNYYNTQWSPGLSVGPSVDDWDGVDPGSFNNSGSNGVDAQSDSWCGNGTTNGRLSETQEESTGIGLLDAFFRFHVNAETAFVHEMTGDQIAPEIANLNAGPLTYINRVYMSYHPAANARIDIAHFESSADTSTTDPLGWSITTDNLSGDYAECLLGVESDTNDNACFNTAIDPYSDNGEDGTGNNNNNNNNNGNNNNNNNGGDNNQSPARAPDPISVAYFGWNTGGGNDATWTATAPLFGAINVSNYSTLQFRGCIDYNDSRNNQYNSQNFSVLLSTPLVGLLGLSTGGTDLFSSDSNLDFPPGSDDSDDSTGQGPVPRCVMVTQRIPLSSFEGVLQGIPGLGLLGANLSNINQIQFRFGTQLDPYFNNTLTSEGAVMLDDIMVANDPTP
jgi:hypothetical protein